MVRASLPHCCGHNVLLRVLWLLLLKMMRSGGKDLVAVWSKCYRAQVSLLDLDQHMTPFLAAAHLFRARLWRSEALSGPDMLSQAGAPASCC